MNKTPSLKTVRETIAQVDAVINRIIDSQELNLAFETEHPYAGRERNSAIIESALAPFNLPADIRSTVASLIWDDIWPYVLPSRRRWGTQHVLLALARIENSHVRMREYLESKPPTLTTANT